MERIDIDYSAGNILIPCKDEYEIQVVTKVGSFIKRIRWEALEYLDKLIDSTKVRIYC